MPYYRFEKGDIFHNRIKTYPKVKFDIYGGNIYYNGAFTESGSFTGSVPNVPSGHVNLFEMNVDRSADVDSPNLIYAFAPKDSDYVTFKTVTSKTFNEALYGDTITFNYSLSASIVRDYHQLDTDPTTPAEGRFRPRKKTISPDGLPQIVDKDTNLTVSSSLTDALRGTFDYYTVLSRHFAYSASHPAWDFGTYDKGHQEMGLIYIPSIFYGSSIKKGSVSLKWYVSGSLIAECADRERNGELIQISGSGRPSANDAGPEVVANYADTIYDFATGSVAGVILYNEGVIALTGAWSLHDSYGLILALALMMVQAPWLATMAPQFTMSLPALRLSLREQTMCRS